MKKRWAIIAAVIGGIIFFLVDLWLQRPLSIEIDTSSFSKQQGEQDAAIHSQYFKLDDDATLDDSSRKLEQVFQEVLKNKHTGETPSQNNDDMPEKVFAANVDSPWIILDASFVTDAVRLREGIDPVQLIQINTGVLRNLHVGDRFHLPPIDEKQYSVVVTKSKTLWNGDSSLAGKIKTQDGNVFPVTILQGSMSTFASVSTPKGSYEIEAFGDIGGLYSVAEIDQQTFYLKTDELTN